MIVVAIIIIILFIAAFITSQAIAVHQSLLLDPREELNVCKFADDLIDKMDKIEVDNEG